MKNYIILSLIILTACGGKLTDEQRKAIKESMQQGQIRRVSDADITEAAFAYGRNVAGLIQKQSPAFADKNVIDSVAQQLNVKVVTLQTDNSTLLEIEKQLM